MMEMDGQECATCQNPREWKWTTERADDMLFLSTAWAYEASCPKRQRSHGTTG